jgi:hypothetical protein
MASIFYGYLQYITVIWYMLWPFGNLVYCPPFWYSVARKIWQPCYATYIRGVNKFTILTWSLQIYWLCSVKRILKICYSICNNIKYMKNVAFDLMHKVRQEDLFFNSFLVNSVELLVSIRVTRWVCEGTFWRNITFFVGKKSPKNLGFALL